MEQGGTRLGYEYHLVHDVVPQEVAIGRRGVGIPAGGDADVNGRLLPAKEAAVVGIERVTEGPEERLERAALGCPEPRWLGLERGVDVNRVVADQCRLAEQ